MFLPIQYGLLLLVRGLCVSVIWTKRDYYLFDSHSKNEKGESSPEGYSILLKFNSINALQGGPEKMLAILLFSIE